MTQSVKESADHFYTLTANKNGCQFARYLSMITILLF